jgi:hypothetical protein
MEGTFGNNICSKGHIGPLCETCDVKNIYFIYIQYIFKIT